MWVQPMTPCMASLCCETAPIIRSVELALHDGRSSSHVGLPIGCRLVEGQKKGERVTLKGLEGCIKCRAKS